MSEKKIMKWDVNEGKKGDRMSLRMNIAKI